ncbi:MAG: AMP-binding protein [Muribaculaceae bacterium]
MEKSMNKYIEESVKHNWAGKALSDLQGVTLSYEDLAVKMAKLQIVFKAVGIKPGDKIALCAKNSTQWASAFFATLTYGAVAVPLLHEFKPDALHHLVNHSEAKLFFVDDSIWRNLDSDKLPELVAVVRMSDYSLALCRDAKVQTAHDNIEQLFKQAYPRGLKPEDIAYRDAEAEDLAVINYTSGSTGNSKGVMIPQRALSSNMKYAIEHLSFLLPGDGVVCMLPLAHMYGLMIDLIHPIVKGCHVYFLSRNLSPKTILEAFREVKPKLVVTVPLIVEKIIKGKVFPLLATPKMRVLLRIPIVRGLLLKKIRKSIINVFGGNLMQLIAGGAALDKDVDKFLSLIRFPFTVGYGMTECAPLLAYSPWQETKSGCSGRLVDRMEMRIDSPDPATIAGELWVKGENVMLGYYHNEEATSAVMKDGWMNTGDLCNVDADGFIFIRGRSKNMILGPSGQNIYPEEIEPAINNLPYVVESIVIEDKGKLIALIYPDFDAAKADGLEGEGLYNALKASVMQANKNLPSYARVADVRIRQQEFEKTPKHSIKRFLYQK